MNPSALCPKCKTELDMDMGSWSEARCGHCGFEKRFDMSGRELLTRVMKEIHRRVRTGEYWNRLGSKSEDV